MRLKKNLTMILQSQFLKEFFNCCLANRYSSVCSIQYVTTTHVTPVFTLSTSRECFKLVPTQLFLYIRWVIFSLHAGLQGNIAVYICMLMFHRNVVQYGMSMFSRDLVLPQCFCTCQMPLRNFFYSLEHYSSQ